MKGLYLYLALLVAPLLFWSIYHYHHDRRMPEPLYQLAIAFLLGMAANYLGQWAYAGLGHVGLRFNAYALAESSLVGLFAYAVLAIGPIEEAVKMLPFLLVVLRFRRFDEPLDGIIHASFIALGFASIENLHYLTFLPGWQAAARGFAGPLVHVAFASVWGYYIGRDWLCGGSWRRTALLALLATGFLHGLYDYIVIALPAWTSYASMLIIVGLWLWRMVKIRDLRARPAERCIGAGASP